jgi:LPS-assembly protein
MVSVKHHFLVALMSSALLLATAPVLAQDAPSTDAPVYLEADTLVDIEGGAGYLARGNVRARQDGRTLFADELEYLIEENRVIARGNVIIYGQGDFPQYADEVELDTALSTGIALGFATMLENNGRVAAATAIRRSDGSVHFDDAYYTACELCENGEHEPTWRLRAREVIQDTEDQLIYYRDAKFEVLGVPVLYAPVFAHADPSSERRSGFLFPAFGVSSRLGAMYQQPYYWSISPSQDVTIAPRVMGNVNPLLYSRYRKRFWSGQMELEGSITNEFEIDSDGERYGDEELRWHLFGGGQWNLNEDWRWGFGVQRTSDDLHLRRYDFSEIDRDRGAPLTALNRRLVSQLYVEGRTENSFASIIGASYQSLRTVENDDIIPEIAPMVELHHVIDAPQGMGRFNLDASAIVLDRKLGSDYTRASMDLDWRTRWVTPNGIVVEPFAHGRLDYYSLEDLPTTGGGPSEDSFDRSLGLVGTEISWPFYRAGETVDWIIEPVISGISATDDPEASRVLNEDSLSLDLDESLLFRPMRASGHDLWEDGERINYGLRATAQWAETGLARIFVGQSQRVDGTAIFNPASGLFEENSDYIVAGEIKIDGFSAELQTRLDSEDGDVNRLDFTANYRSDRFVGSIRYIDISDEASARAPQQEIVASATLHLTDRWSAISEVRQDLDLDLSRRHEFGFRFRDDCTRLDVIYQHEDPGIARLGSSESIQVRITLFTLGSFAEE